jgi:hypothetical protein
VKESYGGPPEGRLLASILGHSLALDLYGAPSPEETAMGAVTHGKVGVLPWNWQQDGDDHLVGSCADQSGQVVFTRELKLSGRCVVIDESVQNLCDFDRHFAWQQHVSLGSPFCEVGFWANSNCDKGKTHPQSFGDGASLAPNTETAWPYTPRRDGGLCDYRRPPEENAVANDFTGFQVQRNDSLGNFVAGNSRFGFALFYLWPRTFFPWLGVWDEKHARGLKPWEKKVSVRAYEFGVSPYPLLRREQLAEPRLFDLPTFLLLPAKSLMRVRYVLGIFAGVTESGEIQVVDNNIVLSNEGRVLSKVTLPCECTSSDRWEMNA